MSILALKILKEAREAGVELWLEMLDCPGRFNIEAGPPEKVTLTLKKNVEVNAQVLTDYLYIIGKVR